MDYLRRLFFGTTTCPPCPPCDLRHASSHLQLQGYTHIGSVREQTTGAQVYPLFVRNGVYFAQDMSVNKGAIGMTPLTLYKHGRLVHGDRVSLNGVVYIALLA